jgi:hypothetical protein
MERAVRKVSRWGSLEENAWMVKSVMSYTSDRTPCSCYRCGNPRRRTGKKTLQEVKLDESERFDEDIAPVEEVPVEEFVEDELPRRTTEQIAEMVLRYVHGMGDVGGYIEGYLSPAEIEDPELATMWHDAKFLIWEIKRKLGLEML